MKSSTGFKRSNRIMLGDISCPEMLIYNNILMVSMDDEEQKKMVGDCEIQFYLGGKPITLHNDMSEEDSKLSLDHYIWKLNKIRDMVSGVLAASKEKPDESYLDRAFLNQHQTAGRLFGGTLLVHYHAGFKMFTLDLCDCNNKTRKSFTLTTMEDFAAKLVDFINESLVSVNEVKDNVS